MSTFFVIAGVILAIFLVFVLPYWWGYNHPIRLRPGEMHPNKQSTFSEILKKNRIPFKKIISVGDVLIGKGSDELWHQIRTDILQGAFDLQKYDRDIDLDYPHLWFHLVEIQPQAQYLVAIRWPSADMLIKVRSIDKVELRADDPFVAEANKNTGRALAETLQDKR